MPFFYIIKSVKTKICYKLWKTKRKNDGMVEGGDSESICDKIGHCKSGETNGDRLGH